MTYRQQTPEETAARNAAKKAKRQAFRVKHVNKSSVDIRVEYEYIRGCAAAIITVWKITRNTELVVVLATTFDLGLKMLAKAGIPKAEVLILKEIYDSTKNKQLIERLK